MKLGKKFEREVRAGKNPALTDDSVQEGQVIVIEPNHLSIVVGKRIKADRWAYLIRDFRPRLLARKSGYTETPWHSMSVKSVNEEGRLEYEPEAITEEEHGRLHREAGAQQSINREIQRVRLEKLRLERRLLNERSPRTAKTIARRIRTADRYLRRADEAA